MEKEERTTTRWIPRLLVWLLIALGTAEALHGFGQLMGLWPSGHSLYRLTGSFYNPGPYMGYLALSLPLCLHEWTRPAQGFDRWRQRAAMTAAALILWLLPAGMSRAAWAAATAAGAYLMKKDSADGRRLMWKVAAQAVCRRPWTGCGWHRLPGRIYPYYLLARLYGETGAFPRGKLEWAVRRVTETEPKVHSTAVREMREQVRRMMEGLE